MPTPIRTEEPPLLSLMKELVDAVATLVGGHLRLARAELGDDARRYARRATAVAIAAALLLVGYALACVAAALALGRVVGPALGFLAVAGVHLAGAGAGLAVLLTRAPPRALDESLTALDRTVATLAELGNDPDRSSGEARPSALGGGTLHEVA